MNHIVIDLEMNTTPKENGMKNELIEIGAVKLDENLEEIDTFHTYVKAVNGPITAIITELTGISQKDIENAPFFCDAMDSFIAWAGETETVFYSWSNCDKKQFEYESEYKNYSNDRFNYMLENWVDIQAEYDRIIGTGHTVALDNALKSAGVEPKGVPHTALGDAVNTAEILKIIKDENKTRERLGNLIDMFKHKEITSSLAEMFPEMVNYLVRDEELARQKAESEDKEDK